MILQFHLMENDFYTLLMTGIRKNKYVKWRLKDKDKNSEKLSTTVFTILRFSTIWEEQFMLQISKILRQLLSDIVIALSGRMNTSPDFLYA